MILVFPAIVIRSGPPTPHFANAPLEVLNASQPENVFIGDSMVYTRIDTSIFESLSKESALVLRDGGSGSARWYLYLKNYVAASQHPPKRVFIMFRDRFLTTPAYRITGSDRERLMSAMRENEPVIEKVLKFSQPNKHSFRENVISTIYPLSEWNIWIRARLNLLAVAILGHKEGQIHLRLERTFDVKNLRSDVPLDIIEGASEQEVPFTSDSNSSFLPHMIELAKESKIELIFYRVKRRPNLRGETPQSPNLSAYIEELKAYLAAQGCVFYDETNDKELTLDIYADGDHVRTTAMKDYTKRFWEKISPRLK